ncbi:MAG: hypothetical protein AB8B69_09315 [Chitinophagales bacterium]
MILIRINQNLELIDKATVENSSKIIFGARNKDVYRLVLVTSDENWNIEVEKVKFE